jgi:hypothetical protein
MGCIDGDGALHGINGSDHSPVRELLEDRSNRHAAGSNPQEDQDKQDISSREHGCQHLLLFA